MLPISGNRRVLASEWGVPNDCVEPWVFPREDLWELDLPMEGTDGMFATFKRNGDVKSVQSMEHKLPMCEDIGGGSFVSVICLDSAANKLN